jgi:hypothetical protein
MITLLHKFIRILNTAIVLCAFSKDVLSGACQNTQSGHHDLAIWNSALVHWNDRKQFLMN